MKKVTRGETTNYVICDLCFKEKPGLTDFFNRKEVNEAEQIIVDDVVIKNRFGPTNMPRAALRRS